MIFIFEILILVHLQIVEKTERNKKKKKTNGNRYSNTFLLFSQSSLLKMWYIKSYCLLGVHHSIMVAAIVLFPIFFSLILQKKNKDKSEHKDPQKLKTKN